MKKTLTMIVAVLLALLLTVPALALPNPIVEVYDDDAFEDTLGIEFDDDEITASPKTMSIIDNTIGQVAFTLENVNAEQVKWFIRFTKDAEIAGNVETFSGIYDEAYTEPFTVTASWTDDGKTYTTEASCVYAQTEGATVYTWQIKDAYFCLVADGTVSQMQLAEILDQAVEASADD